MICDWLEKPDRTLNNSGTTLFENESDGPTGTADYISPEVISGPKTEVSFAADYWALGVIVWQLFNSSHKVTPFNSADVTETFRRIRKGDYKMPEGPGGEPIPEVARDLITKLLERDPAKRLGAAKFSELTGHP